MTEKKIKKVVKGLENCINHGESPTFGCGAKNQCPYEREGVMCWISLNKDALELLKELEAAYQGAVELLRQKTILFDDAIKRLKEQEAVKPVLDKQTLSWNEMIHPDMKTIEKRDAFLSDENGKKLREMTDQIHLMEEILDCNNCECPYECENCARAIEDR